jgi:phenylacetate-CoA ligase
VSGHILVRPASPGVKQEPPLAIDIELGKGQIGSTELAERIRDRLRSVLVFTAGIKLVPFGTLQRSEYKSKLVQH